MKRCTKELMFFRLLLNFFILNANNTLIVLDQGKIPLAMITTIKKLKSGYINGTR